MKFLYLLFVITLVYSEINSNDFDYILFAQVWPGSWLYQSNVNYNFSNDYFTIHGFWANQDLEYCNKTEQFDINEIANIKTSLTEYMTDFKNATKFWAHEFDKHLTCMENLMDPYDFFSIALKIRYGCDLYGVLVSNNIFPSNSVTYKRELIGNTLLNTFGFRPVITCDKYNILEEIRICLDLNLNPFRCPENQFVAECKSDDIWFNKIEN